MEKTQDQIRGYIDGLITKLGLDKYRKDLLKDLRINYRLDSFEDEDYFQLGNTRFGGLPDLPKDVDYPHNDEGYYNLLCQINFSEFKDKLGKLPEDGILYVFNGHSSENDYVVLFSKSTSNLEKKKPPKDLKNLNEEYNKDTYDGLKVTFSLSHYFTGSTIWKLYDLDEEYYHTLTEIESEFESQILTHSMDGLDQAYLQLKGFETLAYTVLKPFKSQLEANLKEIEDSSKNPNISSKYLIRKREQLLKFDKEKEIHIQNMKKVTCLIGLESLRRLGWMWSDLGYKYVYILNEDLEKCNFNNLLVQTWSS
jgi:uncharacterized protein YwqG